MYKKPSKVEFTCYIHSSYVKGLTCYSSCYKNRKLYSSFVLDHDFAKNETFRDYFRLKRTFITKSPYNKEYFLVVNIKEFNFKFLDKFETFDIVVSETSTTDRSTTTDLKIIDESEFQRFSTLSPSTTSISTKISESMHVEKKESELQIISTIQTFSTPIMSTEIVKSTQLEINESEFQFISTSQTFSTSIITTEIYERISLGTQSEKKCLVSAKSLILLFPIIGAVIVTVFIVSRLNRKKN
ncbi:hypothetical protein RF11_11199 [Thelohanellus kitauei]|uniref:Uncharacterized protein n=1 Tax=Thelohanellus kitauei TaxID=669202 RepID=A0A0C2MSF4_THEKT|nr:hypothetical protein RF11_03340 [Thelohanellus kitauei]KII67145.1 hypothetical protein RF11_11199 [Thelohanellus kitauei]